MVMLRQFKIVCEQLAATEGDDVPVHGSRTGEAPAAAEVASSSGAAVTAVVLPTQSTIRVVKRCWKKKPSRMSESIRVRLRGSVARDVSVAWAASSSTSMHTMPAERTADPVDESMID